MTPLLKTPRHIALARARCARFEAALGDNTPTLAVNAKASANAPPDARHVLPARGRQARFAAFLRGDGE